MQSFSLFKWPTWHFVDHILHKVITRIFSWFIILSYDIYIILIPIQNIDIDRVDKWEPSFLLIRTTDQEVIFKNFYQRIISKVFGAFCSTSWGERNQMDDKGSRIKYFGTGECFLFRWVKTEEKNFQKPFLKVHKVWHRALSLGSTWFGRRGGDGGEWQESPSQRAFYVWGLHYGHCRRRVGGQNK